MNKKLYLNLIFLITGSFILLMMGTIVTANFIKDSRLLGNNDTTVAQESPAPKPTPTVKPSQTPSSGSISAVLNYQRETPPPKPKTETKVETKVDHGESMVIPSISPDGTHPTPKPETTPGVTPGATPGTTPGSTPGSTPGTTPGTTPGATPSPKPATTPDSGKTPTPATPTPAPPTPSSAGVKVEVISYNTDRKDLAEQVRSKLEAMGYEVSARNDSSLNAVKTEIIDRNEKNAGSAVRGVLGKGRLTKAADANSRFDVTVILGDDYTQ